MNNKFEIGTEVAFNMNCPCGDLECDGGIDQGYVLHIIDGTENVQFLERCTVFSEETMKNLK
jgi:hypothetical protein